MKSTNDYKDLLSIIEQIEFDRYHLIVLAAQKKALPDLHPEIWKKTFKVNQEKTKFFKRKVRFGTRIIFPNNSVYNYIYYDVVEVLNNRYNVILPTDNQILLYHKIGMKIVEELKKIDKNILERIEEFEIDGRRVAKTNFGYFMTEGNCIKLFFTKNSKTLSLESQLLDGIKELIEKEFILAKDIKLETLKKYLSYFNFNHIELNMFFKNLRLFNSLKLFYDYEGMKDLEAERLLKRFGIRNTANSLNSLRKLNQYETSFYFWVNDSSVLYCYNVTAKKDKERCYNKDGDEFKIELRLKRLSFKNNKKTNMDLKLLKNIQNSPIEKKVKDAISLPFSDLLKEKHSIISFQLTERLVENIRKSRKQKLKIQYAEEKAKEYKGNGKKQRRSA